MTTSSRMSSLRWAILILLCIHIGSADAQNAEDDVETDEKEQMPCRVYEMPKGEHKHPISSIRVNEAFDVIEAGCLINATYGDVLQLEMTLSTHNVGVHPRKMTIQKPSSMKGGSNFTNSFWTDFGESILGSSNEGSYSGVWRSRDSFKKFVRGTGRRTSVGGSKGLWTLELNARRANTTDDLPVLGGWGLYLCKYGQSLKSTPQIKEMLSSKQEEPLVYSFAGRRPSQGIGQLGARASSTRNRRAFPLALPFRNSSSRRRTLRRAALVWMIGSWIWRSSASRLYTTATVPKQTFKPAYHFVEHTVNTKKNLIEHFDITDHRN